jgi:hypothetical protein
MGNPKGSRYVDPPPPPGAKSSNAALWVIAVLALIAIVGGVLVYLRW